MKIISYPSLSQWPSLMQRPTVDYAALTAKVRGILEDVRTQGDEAVRKYANLFDAYQPEEFLVSAEELRESGNLLSENLKKAIQKAKEHIELFHRAQLPKEISVETSPGVCCWQKAVPIDKVGLYIPGGTAPLFSTVLMLAVPAQLAGCRQIVLCSPPDKKTGKIHPAVLYTAALCGLTQVYKIGGVQAIAAMAYGTESLPKVYKIFGPGNQYVMAAKQLVSLEDTAIDMPAGPSEVAVMADDTANPQWVASDLLSQAEHGVDSQVLLLTDSYELAEAVQKECQCQCALLPRREIAEKALENSRIILLKDVEEILAFANEYAPEHLIVSMRNYREIAARIHNAGSVFLGYYSPESAGDYASGTNHTLPTKAYAKAYSGVNMDSFMKKITFQELSREGLVSMAEIIEEMAENEQLYAHRNAVSLRKKL